MSAPSIPSAAPDACCPDCDFTPAFAEHVRYWRMVGAILGYPKCCVEAWVADRVAEHTLPDVRRPSARLRGTVNHGPRTPHNREAVREAVAALRGDPLPEGYDDMYDVRQYVPCDQCALVDDTWRPFQPL